MDDFKAAFKKKYNKDLGTDKRALQKLHVDLRAAVTTLDKKLEGRRMEVRTRQEKARFRLLKLQEELALKSAAEGLLTPEQEMAMVEKAVAANPRSGAVIDSLGWAHYRLGQYDKAVGILEQAVEFEAGDPEINNHLGDAYWMVGRKDEAVFQWKRVLTLRPDDKIKADAEKKLASGVGPAPKLAEH